MPPHRSWLPLLLALPSFAVAQDVSVEVAGYGSVPLADARATCTNGTGIGALATPGEGPRRAALVEWGRLQLAEGEAPEGSWPRHERDLTYNDIELNWVPRGIIASCWAVGQHDVSTGLTIRDLCNSDRTACRDAFAEAERDLVKDALRAKAKDRRDGLFAALSALPDLESWQSPFASLEKACTWPQQAATAGRFIDVEDLSAARAACVQLLELVTGNAVAELAALPCAGSWSQVPSGVQPTPETDLGVLTAIQVASSTEVQLSMLRDKLTRMNPAGTACPPDAVPPEQQALAASFGATWSQDLVASYREAQVLRACGDTSLPVAERLELCPNLMESSDVSCRRGDHEACDLIAKMHLEGVGIEADEAAAFDVWQASCNASHGPACEALLARSERIQVWFASAVDASASATVVATPLVTDDSGNEAATPIGDDPFARANDLLARFGSALGPDWVSDGAKQLFAAAITAQRQKEAGDIITLYGTTLGEEWKAQARTELGALQKVLEKRSTP